MVAKVTFTTSLQIVGSLAPIALILTGIVVGASQRY
jgi:hypothetical protein